MLKVIHSEKDKESHMFSTFVVSGLCFFVTCLYMFLRHPIITGVFVIFGGAMVYSGKELFE